MSAAVLDRSDVEFLEDQIFSFELANGEPDFEDDLVPEAFGCGSCSNACTSCTGCQGSCGGGTK